jgi:hypothetical protein
MVECILKQKALSSNPITIKRYTDKQIHILSQLNYLSPVRRNRNHNEFMFYYK